MTEFTPASAATFIRRNRFITTHDCALLLCEVNPDEQDEYNLPEDYYHWAKQICGLIESGLLQTSTGCLPTADTNLYLEHFIQCAVDHDLSLPEHFKDAAHQHYGIPFELIGRDREAPTDPELVYLQFIRDNGDLQLLFEGLGYFTNRQASVKTIENYFTDKDCTREKATVFRYIIEAAKKSQ